MILFSIGEVSNPYPEDQFWLAIWANNRDAAVEKFDQEWQREGSDPLTPDEKSKLRIEDCSPKGFSTEEVGHSKVETNSMVLHKIGWGSEDQTQCESCDLYFDSVCQSCQCCSDCCECVGCSECLELLPEDELCECGACEDCCECDGEE